MYTLYYSPGACSMAPHVLLNELGIPFKANKVDLHAGEGQKPEYLKINPRGNVPVLMDDATMIREGAAILLYLLDKHESKLMPRAGAERVKALEWLMFANASLHPAYGTVFFLMYSGADKVAQEQLMGPAYKKIDKMWAEVDAQLAKTPYICGADITIADILMTVIADWSANLPKPVQLPTNVKRMIKEVSQRPAYQKALATEQVEYKAAA